MSARTFRPRPRAPVGRQHVPHEDPDTPGVCMDCRRPMTAANDRHIALADLPPNPAAAGEARRLGERDQGDA